MKIKNVILSICLLGISTCFGQTIWSGPTITFTKSGGADWTLEENQDRITDNVWLTRANNQGIFNIVTETGYTPPSPADTEWAFGTTADIGSLTFDTWVNTHGGMTSSMINQSMVLHLITDDIYIDLMFLTFTNGANGASFSYERSTMPPLNIFDEQTMEFQIVPNPAHQFIKITGLTASVTYHIYNSLGEEVKNGQVADGDNIVIESLPNALYLIKLDSGKVMKFIKN